VGGAHLVALPVHRQRVSAEDLDPVHPDIADAAGRVGGNHHRQRDVAPAVPRPGGEERNPVEIDCLTLEHDLLAGRPTAAGPGRKFGDFGQPGQHGQFAEQAFRHLEVEQLLNPAADVVELLAAQGQADPPHRAEEIDGDWMRARAAVLEKHLLEEKGGPPTGALHAAIGDLGDLQSRPDRLADPHQLTGLLDGGQEFPQVIYRHSDPEARVDGADATQQQAVGDVTKSVLAHHSGQLPGSRKGQDRLWQVAVGTPMF